MTLGSAMVPGLGEIGRLLLYLGLAATLGSLLMTGWLSPRPGPEGRRRLAWMLGLGTAAVAAATVLVPLRLALELGVPVSSLLPAYVTGTVQGRILGLRLASLAVLVGIRAGADRLGLARALQAGVALAVVVTVGLTGHAAARPDLLLAHTLHLAGVAVWGGGLLALGWALEWGPHGKAAGTAGGSGPSLRAAEVVAAVGRFSRLAGAVFGVLLLAGAYLGVTLAGSGARLADDSYGRWLLAKGVVVALVAAAAALNRWQWLRRSSAAGPGGGAGPSTRDSIAYRRLRLFVRLEGVLLLVVLALTAVLAGQPPPALGAPD